MVLGKRLMAGSNLWKELTMSSVRTNAPSSTRLQVVVKVPRQRLFGSEGFSRMGFLKRMESWCMVVHSVWKRGWVRFSLPSVIVFDVCIHSKTSTVLCSFRQCFTSASWNWGSTTGTAPTALPCTWTSFPRFAPFVFMQSTLTHSSRPREMRVSMRTLRSSLNHWMGMARRKIRIPKMIEDRPLLTQAAKASPLRLMDATMLMPSSPPRMLWTGADFCTPQRSPS
mmetsp:Transcript_37966/g.109567  ORF Transcript_37966/g.109567 Transcript_37966/m.109567 type:complete len:225 (-) Transcript_37966:272-946(-)